MKVSQFRFESGLCFHIWVSHPETKSSVIFNSFACRCTWATCMYQLSINRCAHPVKMTIFCWSEVNSESLMCRWRSSSSTVRQQQRIIQLGTAMIYDGHFTSALTPANMCNREAHGTDRFPLPPTPEYHCFILKNRTQTFWISAQNKSKAEKTA